MCKAMDAAAPGGEAPLSNILHNLASRIRRRGFVIILSDGFDRIEDLSSALRHLRHRRHEVLFLHMLAPEEEEFPFRRPARFRNLENVEHALRVDPLALRLAYLEKFRARLRGPARPVPVHPRRLPQDFDK